MVEQEDAESAEGGVKREGRIRRSEGGGILNHVGTSFFTLEGFGALAAARGGQTVWVGGGPDVSWAELSARVGVVRDACLAAGLGRGEGVVTPGEASLEAVVWLLGAAQAGARVAPLRRARRSELDTWKDVVRMEWQVNEEGRLERNPRGEDSPAARALIAELMDRGHAGLILATGGTTGKPKLVLHDLDALLALNPVTAGVSRRILPLMRFDHIGGLDVLWRALAGGHVVVAPPEDLSPDEVGRAIARQRVEVMPATPSWLNLFLVSEAGLRHDLSSLRTVPYGAEPMPAGLLARLRKALPAVEFGQRFGTSETGALPVESVGEEGMRLRAAASGVSWKVVEGELWIKTPARALGYLTGEPGGFAADGWYRTGDLAEVSEGGLVRVLGRKQDVINVGGEKVLPATVEAVILEHPRVADCRVLALANALLGQVVAVEVVWRGEAAGGVLGVKRELHAFAEGRLARHQLPAVVRLVAEVGGTVNFKKARG